MNPAHAKGPGRRPGHRASRSQVVQINRRLWQDQSDQYDRRCARVLGGRSAQAWGLWRLPESELRLLGQVRGRSVLEAGCGAARWSVALAHRGARVVGLDFSSAQLRHARREVQRTRARVRLVQGDAHRLPFRSRAFDIVFADWGALTFADPFFTIPECARVLRPGGVLVFATMSPIRVIAQDEPSGRVGRHLRRSYFTVHRVDYPDEVNFSLPYGTWVELFGDNGFAIERLIEVSGNGRSSAYLTSRERVWSRRWPLESIWVVRKSPEDERFGRASRSRRRPTSRRKS